MNTKAFSLQALTNQLKELDIQIHVLNKKKTMAEMKVAAYSKELVLLKAKQHVITHDLHQVETPGYYMWENIGEGG